MALAELLRNDSTTDPDYGELPRLSDDGPGPGLDPDPTPGKPVRSRRSRPAMKAEQRQSVSRAGAVKEITSELEMYCGLAAMTISARGDEVCAAAVSAQAKELAAATAALIARSDRLLGLVHSGGLLADITRLAMAAWPIAVAVRAHHGRAARQQGEGQGGDPLAGFPAFGAA